MPATPAAFIFPLPVADAAIFAADALLLLPLRFSPFSAFTLMLPSHYASRCRRCLAAAAARHHAIAPLFFAIFFFFFAAVCRHYAFRHFMLLFADYFRCRQTYHYFLFCCFLLFQR